MPDKKKPVIVCLWHAQNPTKIGIHQKRMYNTAKHPHTCRVLNCKVYLQKQRKCTPANPHHCSRCPWTDFPEPPPEPFPPDE